MAIGSYSNALELSRDIRVTILIEIIERGTGKSIIAPTEFTCEVGRHVFDCHPDDISDLFLCRIAKEQYYGALMAKLRSDVKLSGVLNGRQWGLDAVLLERHNITFGEVFKKLGIK